MTASNGFLYFSAQGDLWKSDGTEAGTVRFPNTSPVAICDVNGVIYFISDGDLWRPDGSEVGTYVVGRSHEYRIVYDLVDFNGVLYFTCYGSTGFELWKSDGTTGEHRLSSVLRS